MLTNYKNQATYAMTMRCGPLARSTHWIASRTPSCVPPEGARLPGGEEVPGEQALGLEPALAVGHEVSVEKVVG